FDTNAIINRYDYRIAITMLSDLVLLGGEKTGSFAMAETKQSLLATALNAQLLNIADVFNKYAVPKLMHYNNFENITDYPRIVPGNIESPSLKEIALLLRSMGLNISNDMELMNYLRKISSLPQMTEEVFNEVYRGQSKKESKDKSFNDDDTVDNDFEQSDLDYM